MALVVFISTIEIRHKIGILDSPKEKIPELGCQASFPVSFPRGLPSGDLDLASQLPDPDLHANEYDIVNKNYPI